MVIFKMIGDNKNFLDEFSLKLIEKLKKSGLLYYKNVYDVLHHPNNNFLAPIDQNKNSFKKIILLFSESGTIKKIFQIFFHNINIIKFDTSDLEDMYYEFLLNFRTHKDSMSAGMCRRREHGKRNTTSKNKISGENDENTNSRKSSTSSGSNKEEKIKLNSESENGSSMNNSVDSIIEEFNNKVRPRHNNVDMRSKSNYIKQFSRRGSLNSINVCKAEYEKIIFNITIPKYFGKEYKILEINKNGFFMIYKKEKVSKEIKKYSLKKYYLNF